MPKTSSIAASRLPAIVVALVMLECVPYAAMKLRTDNVLRVLREVDPARVGLELAVAGHLVEFAARGIQRGNAGIAATREVDGREVERQAQQVVAERVHDELVDLVTDLSGQAAHDGAGRHVSSGAALIKLERVEEGFDQADLARREVGVQAVDRLGQHRVAETIDGVRELGDDRRIDRGLEPGRGKEDVDLRLDLAREFLEHKVLILHFGGEFRRLEQTIAVPHAGRDLPLGEERRVGGAFLQDRRLDGIDEAVVLGVEDVVDGGQGDVLVNAAVAGDKVRVEQLIVVGCRIVVVADDIVGIGRQPRPGLAVQRVGGMRDVFEEGVAGANGERCVNRVGRSA
jgi:hypothetical protein